MIGPGRNNEPASVLTGEAVGADGVCVAAGGVAGPMMLVVACDVMPAARVQSGSATAAASTSPPTAATAGRRRRIMGVVSCARSYHSNQSSAKWLHRLPIAER